MTAEPLRITPELYRMLWEICEGASTDEGRPSLHSVYLEYEGTALQATSTDGYMICHREFTLPNTPALSFDSLLVDVKALRRALRQVKVRVRETNGLISAEPEGLTISLKEGHIHLGSFPVPQIDGGFPDYRRWGPGGDLEPKRPRSVDTICLNPNLLEHAARSLGADANEVVITFYGRSRAMKLSRLKPTGENDWAVLMPVQVPGAKEWDTGQDHAEAAALAALGEEHEHLYSHRTGPEEDWKPGVLRVVK